MLSSNTAGCNLACRFCQNWDISKSRTVDRLADAATPEAIAATAQRLGARSVAFTYNEPVIFLEYAIDVADACRERGIRAVAVSAGYVCPEPRRELFAHMDAANIDKAFSEEFYARITAGKLHPVLDTLRYLRHETDVWSEITTLLVPGHNDGDAEIDAMSHWIAERLGPDVPLHFTAFDPDFKMRDVPPTPPATLSRARQIALRNGLRYVYTGNVHDTPGATTYCPGCATAVIERNWYEIGSYAVTDDGRCRACGTPLPGRYGGAVGGWGPRRLAVRLAGGDVAGCYRVLQVGLAVPAAPADWAVRSSGRSGELTVSTLRRCFRQWPGCALHLDGGLPPAGASRQSFQGGLISRKGVK